MTKFLFFAVVALGSLASADCTYYWTGSGYVWRCEEPFPIPSGPNCHWETSSSTGQTYWVCD